MKKLLLIEDDKRLALKIQAYLQQSNFEVDWEQRGDRAVYRVSQYNPDLIILDLGLPGLSGLKVCELIRKDYNGLILILTADVDDNSHISGLATGADDYVNKPIKPQVLLARIEALLRRGNATNNVTHLQFGQLIIDRVNQSVTLAGNSVQLKPKEFELLLFLASNADTIVTRNMITNALSGFDYDGVSRNIDLRISYLRNKLLDDSKKPFRIITSHAKGYVFVSTAWG